MNAVNAVKNILWKKAAEGDWYDAVDLPLWRDGRHPHGVRWTLWLQPRPAHCDRGRWLLGTSAPIDHQEGFPRYYFSLEVAKSEALEWVRVREELRETP